MLKRNRLKEEKANTLHCGPFPSFVQMNKNAKQKQKAPNLSTTYSKRGTAEKYSVVLLEYIKNFLPNEQHEARQILSLRS